jgi:predicted nucleic acid-binding protein
MLIYLDMCSLQRPYDEQSQLRVMIEADAVLGIIALCETGQVELVSSVALDFENERNPYADRKARIRELLGRATRYVPLSPAIETQAKAFVKAGIKPLDSLHFACALESGSDYFCTCDDRPLKRARQIHTAPPKVLTPLELIVELGS